MPGGKLNLGPFPFTGLPVTVPSDFVGLTFRGWPITDGSFRQEVPFPSTVSVAPTTLGYGHVRLWAAAGGVDIWRRIETSPGSFNWANLDTVITQHRTDGKSVLFEIYGPPATYLAAGNPNAGVNDTFSLPGAQCYPGQTSTATGGTGGSSSVTLTTTASSSGVNLAVGTIISGTGVTAGTTIAAIGTAVNGVGTYIMSVANTITAGTTITAHLGLTALKTFITTLITRYNNSGGAWRLAHGGLGKGIQFLECWNEAVNPTNADGNASGNFGYWTGTNNQLVDCAQVVYATAKGIDAAITVLSPSSYDCTWTQTWLGAAGNVYNTKTGGTSCDAVALHIYTKGLPYTSSTDGAGVTSDILQSYYEGYSNIKVCVAAAGYPNIPIYITEAGYGYTVDPTNPTQYLLACNNWSDDQKYKYWARIMMFCAAWGYKQFCTYCWERPFSCNMNLSPGAATQRALTTIHNSVAGKTINSGTWSVGGEVTLNFSDATSLTV
jgi:hypothetical protein